MALFPLVNFNPSYFRISWEPGLPFHRHNIIRLRLSKRNFYSVVRAVTASYKHGNTFWCVLLTTGSSWLIHVSLSRLASWNLMTTGFSRLIHVGFSRLVSWVLLTAGSSKLIGISISRLSPSTCQCLWNCDLFLLCVHEGRDIFMCELECSS